MIDNLTILRQRHRNDYMKSLAEHPDPPISVAEQSPQADRWWPGTVRSKWERGRWVPAWDCDVNHPYDEEGWRPGEQGRPHEHWEYPDE